DLYTNPVLARVPEAEGVKEITRLTPDLIADHDRVLPGSIAAFVVVRTNGGRWSKLLVQAGARKIDEERSLPILLVERYATYKEGTDEAVTASGRNVYLFPGYRFQLEMGQVVPEELGGDLRFITSGDKTFAETLGKAKMYLVTKPLPQAAPKKPGKFVIGERFEPKYFNGTFKLHDDGRRSGKLTLKVDESGEVTGSYVSDTDGEKYEVKGKVLMPQNAISFTIKFPRVEQTFQGWMFTGDGKVIAGSSRLLEREAGFYAVRLEEE